MLCGAMLTVSVIGGCGNASKPAPHAPSPSVQHQWSATTWQHQPPGKAAGEAVAQQLVAAAVLPAGAQRLAKSPSPGLNRPSSTLLDLNLIDHYGWWKVNLSPPELLAYLRHRPPAGLISSGSASGSSPDEVETDSLSFGPKGAAPGRPQLLFTVTAAGERASWLRVDGQTIWYPPRPAAENAPADGTVTISLSSGPTRKVSEQQSVRRLGTEFNRLIRTTPLVSTGVACLTNQRTLSLAFTKAGTPHPTVVTTKAPCAPAWEVSGPGGALPSLDGGADLLTDALRLLGLTSNALLPQPQISHP